MPLLLPLRDGKPQAASLKLEASSCKPGIGEGLLGLSACIGGFYHPRGSEIEIEDEIEIDGSEPAFRYHHITVSPYHPSP